MWWIRRKAGQKSNDHSPCPRAGLEKQSDLFIVHNSGHGTREFFQPETQQVILAQLRKYLGRAAD